jgi:hypothetical protein
LRYYQIIVTRADGSPYLFKSTGNAFAPGVTLSSLLPSAPQNPQTGLTNPAALLVEWDIPVANFTDPDGQSAWLRVWGLGLSDLGSASDLNNCSVQVFGGMAKGLPLANPAQAGLLMSGTILQAFGNWNGTDQTLDLLFAVGGNTAGGNGGFAGAGKDASANFPFSMPAGTTLARAIANTLSIALPDIPPTISISPKLTLNYDQTGHYGSLYQFASFVQALSVGIIGDPNYNGVQIVSDGSTINVFDGAGPAAITSASGATSTPTVKNIAFQDLIGQPTWIGPNAISFKCVMRADIHQGDTVMLPPTLVTQNNTANSNFSATPQTKLTFSGKFLVMNVHHYGHSRQSDAASWNSTYQAIIV